MNVRDKVECLSLPGLSGLVLCLWVRSAAYPSESEAPQRCFTLGQVVPGWLF
jgi:hypothetical protein